MSKFTHFSVTVREKTVPFSSVQTLMEYLDNWHPSTFFNDKENRVHCHYEGVSYGYPFCFSDLTKEVEVPYEKIKEIIEGIEININKSSERIRNKQCLSGEFFFYPKERAKYVVDSINYYRFVWKSPEEVKFEEHNE